MVLTGFTVGFALFYEVGFVLMLPLVFTIAASARIPLLYVGVPMAAALSVTHGFLPPHPGPTAIATIFHADMGKTLLYGTILAIPTVILAGPVFARFLKGIDKPIPEGLHNPKVFTEEEMPGFGVSVWTSLVPVILMAMRAVAEMILPKGHAFPANCRVLRRPGDGHPDCGTDCPVHLRFEPRPLHGADQRYPDLFD
ncbi:High-affinity gluconate transporter GntT [Klebsiella pneumoniae]|uniref:High-affinity gluconate transporter GntT n=1 Tax=Klebsiella pneumoniae TaxID=573 RepID=A0A377U4J0_KLEPN|nr:High-affinity gluconate transporter GntT [Klebsiella pneumoniae]